MLAVLVHSLLPAFGLTLCLWCSAFFASPAVAQAVPPPADVAEARARFAAGQAAVEAGRWVDAVRDFRRAYELTRVPSALFNTAFALRALGRYREAAELFTQVRDLPSVSPEMRDQAIALLDEVRSRIATMQLNGLASERDHTIRVDGVELDDTRERPVRISVDPGSRRLEVSAAGFDPFQWGGDVEDGATIAIDVDLQPIQAGRSVVEEPWFWIVGGLIVVAIGGAITGVVLDDQAQLRPASPMAIQF